MKVGGGSVLLGLAPLLLALGGCNAITGADDIVLKEPGAVAPGDGTTGGGPTGGGTGDPTGGNDTGGTGGPVDEPPPPPPLGAVDGVTITDIDLYQAIRRPIVAGGAEATSEIPVVAGKTSTLRIFYTTDAGYNGQPVTARVTIGDAPPIESEHTLGAGSTQKDLASTVNVEVPGERMTLDASYRVELLQLADQTSGANAAAAYPVEGTAPLKVEQGAKRLKILVVPVKHDGELPDTSSEQMALFEQHFEEAYPVPDVEITVRETPHVFNGSLYGSWGWSELLDQISELRNKENIPDDVYLYGLNGGGTSGIAGLGWVGGPSDVWSRAAIGMGWTGEGSVEVAVHEIGHTHGFPHAPCGVSGDPDFPHAGAGIGVWGYRPSKKKLLDPDKYVDFMSYCDPQWISDYTFRGIFKRAKAVDQSPKIVVPAHLKDRTWERVRIVDGVAAWLTPVKLAVPPMGETTTVTVQTVNGAMPLTGHLYRYSHIDGGQLYVLKEAVFAAAEPLALKVQLGNKTFTAKR
jgi:hypothetical protein